MNGLAAAEGLGLVGRSGAEVQETELLPRQVMLALGETDPTTSITTAVAKQPNEMQTLDAFSTKGLHIIHLNIRSIRYKISQIRMLVQSSKIGIICLSETWLESEISDSEIEIENFTVIRKDRNRNGGGVVFSLDQTWYSE